MTTPFWNGRRDPSTRRVVDGVDDCDDDDDCAVDTEARRCTVVISGSARDDDVGMIASNKLPPELFVVDTVMSASVAGNLVWAAVDDEKLTSTEGRSEKPAAFDAQGVVDVVPLTA